MDSRHHGTACKTCRKSGRRCDKSLPECQSCIKRGKKCEGYVLRWAGIASRGKFAGKSLPVEEEILRPQSRTVDATTILQPDSFDVPSLMEPDSEVSAFEIPSPWNDVSEAASLAPLQTDVPFLPLFDKATTVTIELGYDQTDPLSFGPEETPLDTEHVQSQAMVVVPTLHNPLDPFNIPNELRFILNYHLIEVAPRLCVDNNCVKNPYSQYILPLAMHQPSLLYACAALAACHFNVRLSHQSFYVECLKFRGKAMKRLQEHLYSERTAKDEATLGTILMLTLCDICLGGFSNFDAHFSAAKQLVDLRGPERTSDSFVEQSIAWLDTMAATSHSRKPLFSAQEISEFTGDASDWSFDVFPCPIDQFKILSAVVELYKSQLDPDNPPVEVLAQVEKYKTELLMRPMHIERGVNWLHLTEAYRHSIVLYMMRLFRCGNDQDEIDWLTQSVFYHAKSTPISTGWADQLLWPLFHAALEIKDERRKQWLRERSIYMQLSGGFRNVQSAMEILERVWSGESPTRYMDLLAGDGAGNMLLV